MIKKYAVLSIAVIYLSILLLSFQNCSGEVSKKSKDEAYSKIKTNDSGGTGNGEPYGGKPTYLALEAGYKCKDNTGKEVASPVGVLQLADNGKDYALKFENCAEADVNIEKAEVMTVQLPERAAVVYNNKVYQKFNQYPDITKIPIPEKFCFESKLLSLLGSAQSDTFFEINTLSTYNSGRSTRFLKREIVKGVVNIEKVPLKNIEIISVLKEETSSFMRLFADLFSIEIDYSQTILQKINQQIFSEFHGVTDYQLQGETSVSNSELTCTNFPALPLYLPPPTKTASSSITGEAPAGVVPPPPPPPPPPGVLPPH